MKRQDCDFEMTEEQWNAILKQKNDLICAQAAEIDHLRAALQEIANDPTGLSIGQSEIAKLTLASYMSENGWVRQTDDGSIVPGYKP
jgi:hypothetical protein